ncbi:hypothetical protein LTR10_024286 [Elasticomyces elasticus]|uniref:Fungal N-terminal domain-containing protein n=1 Tax=Exophiala sideris TaxID=1016849 RepID=A0ABR0JLF8_9EURO|nr:hypothetical protein LTR10_024286 [Elasticomyces elasticus]KAK5036422.1 hypothetical protein LTS07_002149 [Exophiala sideris]KAK5041746.1 hypothetical protein LTR13_002413 [Exophiala sideris]KAK5066806.1 hypothetical protein LTR69_002153 [Exophiala sideris]KAK5184864.1 hypothetical protein LTR44_002710 [Eurotiomycetes sp. CCFEE 6388]
MAAKTRFSNAQAGEPATLAEVCKLAWHTFYGMQKASEDFENLRFEVWTIAISVDSLHSVGTTSTLIDRQPDKARWALTFSKILTSLSSALRPLYSLVGLYLSTPAKDRGVIRNWLTHPEQTYEGVTIQDFRRKLSMLVESLNVFLSCLTHAELARARERSETEEWRVLAEVSQNVLHKWEQDVASDIRRPMDKALQPHVTATYVNASTTSYLTAALENEPQGLGLQLPKTSLSLPKPRHERQGHHPGGVMDLDDIEHGFRSHMHAMRRIREQLRQQKVNTGHLSDQSSQHFPEVTSNTISHRAAAAFNPPPTPITPTLHRHATDSTQSTQTDSSAEYADASSSSARSAQSSETGSVISTYQNSRDESTKPPPASYMAPRRSSAERERKRKRRTEFRFKTGLEDQSSQSNDSSGSDEVDDRLRPKTALEQFLTTALFFDQ